MGDENLQYTLTFRTRAEGTGAKETAEAIKRVNDETTRRNALSNPEQFRQSVGGEYDLSRAIRQTEEETKKATFQTNENNFAKIRAKQAAQQLVDQLKLEELAKKKAANAATGAVKGQRDLGAATLEVSRAFEDAQYGMRGMLNNLPVLIGMLGGSAGLAGAVSIGAVVISIFAGKLEKLQEQAKASGEQAAKLKEELIELAAAQAVQEIELYISRLEQAETITKNIADAEVRRIALAAEQAAANRRVEASQDLLTGAALEYLSAIGGIEAVEQRRVLKQREADREQKNQLDAQQVRIDQAKKSYENLTAEIERMKQALADAAARKEELEVEKAGLTKMIDVNRGAGYENRAKDLEIKLQPVLAELAMVKGQLADLPKQIDSLVADASAQAIAVDEAMTSAKAQMEAINAEFANKANASELATTVEDNRRIVGDLSKALEDFKATTPAQAEAAASIAAALADGKLTTQELAGLSTQLKLLGPELTNAVQGNGALVDKLIKAVQQLAAKQRDQDRIVEGLLNGIK